MLSLELRPLSIKIPRYVYVTTTSMGSPSRVSIGGIGTA